MTKEITAEQVEKRFYLSLRITSTGCHEWTGYVNTQGYGVTQFNKKQIKTHRVAWELANGPIPEGLCVLHRCDNPPCVNVEHLFLGTYADNVADMISKGRHYKQKNTHCTQGHLYGEVKTFPNARRRRTCQICLRTANARFRAKRGPRTEEEKKIASDRETNRVAS